MAVLNALTIVQLRHIADLAAAARASAAHAGNVAFGLAEAASGYVVEPAPIEVADGHRPLRAEVASLGAAARAELLAVAKIGRRALDVDQLGRCRAEAAAMDDDDIAEIVGRASFGDDLDAGAELLGLSLK